ncbi:MAG: AAA family ATPase, partial [bacterium]
MGKLKRVFLNGFKSFRFVGRGMDTDQQMVSGNAIEFGDVTVLLGANGAGKSNVISLFRMLNYMMTGALQEFVGKGGGATSFLHYGPKATPEMQAVVEFQADQKKMRYEMILTDAPRDILMFVGERVFYHDVVHASPQEFVLQIGHQESDLPEAAKDNDPCRVIHDMLSRCRTYQFNDTSAAANLRKPSYKENARYLMSEAGNLAPCL